LDLGESHPSSSARLPDTSSTSVMAIASEPACHKLPVSMFNARSSNNCNKMNDSRCYLSVKKPVILCITETWLQPATNSSWLTPGTCYALVRNDCIFDWHGGVCILINSVTVTAVKVPIPSKFSGVELIAVDVLSIASN
jgi:hypothetical protein